ncbi:MAG: immunity 52 family protein [Planctomycetia bacterium]|nr:immunity 52 family protein [Planctomycetia bacterium]
MDDLYIGAYWGPRRESADQCADRLTQCLRSLANCDAIFRDWYKKGRANRTRLAKPVDWSSHDILVNLLNSGRSRLDSDHSVMEDLGFIVSLWNRAERLKASDFMARCGLYTCNPFLGNSFVLDLPKDLGTLAQKENLLKAFVAIVEAWEPNWAGVISRRSRDAREFVPGRPFVDWMIYVNRTDVDSSALPATASTKCLNEHGAVIVVQNEPINPDNERDLENVRSVERALGL